MVEGHEVEPATLLAATAPVGSATDRVAASGQTLVGAPVSAAAYPQIPNGRELGSAHEAAVRAIADTLAELQQALERIGTRLTEAAREYEQTDLAADAAVQDAAVQDAAVPE
jgi:uncharacterized protein YukE